MDQVGDNQVGDCKYIRTLCSPWYGNTARPFFLQLTVFTILISFWIFIMSQSQHSHQDHGAMTEQDKHDEKSTYDTPSRPASVEPPVETSAEKHTTATSEFK
jgi:hypothetical protein